MGYLLDHDPCIAWLRRHRHVMPPIVQNAGQLHVSALTLMKVERWLLRPSVNSRLMQGYNALLSDLIVVSVDDQIAHRAVMLERGLRRQAHHFGVFALIVAATALERGHTLVTHDSEYQHVAGLALADWKVP